MKKWEKALVDFLAKYEKEPFFEGALLCGSYASGNQNAFSDIDVHILISDTQNWRERGNIEVDGFLIEYFINPVKQIRKEFQEDILKGRINCANMFAYGKIVKDVQGTLKQLQKEGFSYLKKPMPKYKRKDFAFDFYEAWDLMDELKSLSRDKKSLGLVYYKLLEHLLFFYFKAKQISKIPLAKTEKIFADPIYARKYHIQKLPDKKFIELFLIALPKQNVKNMQKLYDYVIKELGGFDIKTFRSKSEINL